MRGYLSRLLWPLPKTGLSLTKHVLKPIAKNYLTPLGFTTAASATDAATHRKNIWICHKKINKFRMKK